MLRVAGLRMGILGLCIIACGLAEVLASDGPPVKPPAVPTPEEVLKAEAMGDVAPVERLGPGLFRLGRIEIDENRHLLTMPGSVNQSEGLVELLACGPRGKRHESVLVVDVNPYHLQLALLLLGLDPGGNLRFQGDRNAPEGDEVDVLVSWGKDAARVEKRAEELVLDKKAGRAMDVTSWIFTGSSVVNGVFTAGLEQSLIATYRDPGAIINNPLEHGTDDTVYYANSGTLPPVGTPVKVVIRKHVSRP